MEAVMGKALVIDLTTGETETRAIPEQWFTDYLGGEGTGVRLFYDIAGWDRDPLDPIQPIIFATGPLTGTATPASSRMTMVFRSPATTTLGLTNVGGRIGPAIKRAGWDMIAVKGRSEKPVFVSVLNDKVEVHDASDLWGKGVFETEDIIKEKIGQKGLEILSIGPAGENLVRYGSVMTDKHRAAGRAGGGAAMGSKNLKAIAITGSHSVSIAKPEEFKDAVTRAKEELLDEAFVKGALKPFGTPGFYDPISQLGILPTKNWQRTSYDESIPKMGTNRICSVVQR